MSSPTLATAQATRAEHPPEDPTMSTTPVSFSSTHWAIGLSLRVESNDQRVHQAALESFGPVIELDETDAVIRLLVHHVDEEPGWTASQPLVRVHSGLFSISASRASTAMGDLRSRTASGFVSETVASNPDFLRAAFLQSAFLQFAQGGSLAAIHTACLAHGDGDISVMLRGESGAGKSTLCYALLRRGWSLVAEDVVFVRTTRDIGTGRVQPEDIELHGLPWSLHLLPDAPFLFPELRGLPMFERPNGELKIGVDVAARFPGQARSVAPLGRLVFLRRSLSGHAVIAPITRDDAQTLLHATAIIDEAQISARHGLWDAFLHTDALLLETGNDPDENAALLEATLFMPASTSL